MLFTPDAGAALRSAVELVNSSGNPDALTTLEDLDRWWTSYGYTGRHDRDHAELTALRALRPRRRGLLTADRDSAAHQVNTALAAGPACLAWSGTVEKTGTYPQSTMPLRSLFVSSSRPRWQ